jgi:hypothetical protein
LKRCRSIWRAAVAAALPSADGTLIWLICAPVVLGNNDLRRAVWAAAFNYHGMNMADSSANRLTVTGIGVPCTQAQRRLSLGVGLLVLAIVLSSATRQLSSDVASHTLRPYEGQVFAVELVDLARWPWQAPGDDMEHPRRSTVQLFEDGHPLGPAHALHVDIIAKGGGAFSHWRNTLIFSTSDGSDALTNGRTYQITAEAELSPTVIAVLAWLGTLLVIGGMLTAARCSRDTLVLLWQSWSRHLYVRRGALALAALPPVAASVWSWAFVPFIWNGTDSAGWFIWQWELFPHFPLLYPALMAAATQLPGGANTALTAVVAAQHLLALFAVIYIATAFQRAWQILMLALVATLALSYSLFSHGIMTEALALPCLLLVIGSTLRLRPGAIRFGALAVMFFAVVVGMLTRHIFVVFALIPLLSMSLVGWRLPLHLRIGHNTGPWFVAVGLASITVAAAWGSATALTTLTCRALESPCTSIVGRAGLYRVLYTWEQLPDARHREDWMATLAEHADDPIIAQALRIMATAEHPWLGAYQQISQLPQLYGDSADSTMNAAFRVFLTDGGTPATFQLFREFAIAVIGSERWKYGAKDCSGQAHCLLRMSAHSIRETFPRNERIVSALSGTSGVEQEGAERLFAVSDSRAIAFLSQLQPTRAATRTAFVGASFLLVLFATWRAGLTPTVACALALWMSAMAYALAVTLVTVMVVRYLAPVDMLLWTANALALIALTNGGGVRFSLSGGADER